VHNLETVLIIPAAGAGTRLQSPLPKVLTTVNERPMIDHLFDLYRNVAGRFVLIVHPSIQVPVKAHCDAVVPHLEIGYVAQNEPTGMLDAVLLAADTVRPMEPGRIWITWCDQVGIHPKTIHTLQRLSKERSQSHIVMPTSRQVNPYIHLDRDSEGRIFAVRQRREGDPMPVVGESDIGLFSLSHEGYFNWLPRFGSQAGHAAGTRERNFLPFIPWMASQTHSVLTFPCTDEMEAIGINTPEDRRRLEQYLKERDRS
jgi:bifunctional UDP-N-acetylglucosamine pyrophosphorylase/glucosamine-1-phosphate N-acetyltransferase